MKILIAVDGSQYTKRMLAYLTVHEEFLGADHEYTVLHTVAQVPVRAAASVDKAQLSSYYADEAEKVLKPIRTFLGKRGIEANIVVKTGSAPETICSVAEKGKYELIVMGSHGHGTLSNLVLGSVTTKVLANCRIPVLLVR